MPIITLVTGTAGTFFSPNYPSNYTNNYEEQYSIRVEDGSQISLYFQYFNLEYHRTCHFDYIEGNLIANKTFNKLF